MGGWSIIKEADEGSRTRWDTKNSSRYIGLSGKAPPGRVLKSITSAAGNDKFRRKISGCAWCMSMVLQANSIASDEASPLFNILLYCPASRVII